MVYSCCEHSGMLTSILTFTAALLIYYYRTLTESVYLLGVKPSKSKMCLILFWLNIFEIIILNYIPILYKKITCKEITKTTIKTSLGGTISLFCIISALLHKPHNVILNGLCILTCGLVNKTCDSLFTGKQIIWSKIISNLMIGKMFYFYQGNSNSLATIDVNAGYVGLESFNLFTVGVFLTVNTFSGPILSLLALIHNIYDTNERR